MMYLFKIILCTGLLYAFYYLILRKQRMFGFNRFFLLSIMIISMIIPFITVQTSVIEIDTTTVMPFAHEVTAVTFSESPTQPQTLLSNVEIALSVYALVVILMISRFILNLLKLRNYRKGGELTFYNNTPVILRPDTLEPFSFLNHIYTSQKINLPLEILEHEKAHIDQRHSYDILFTELMICLFWFNPFLFLIRKAIKLNHEFLADESVLTRNISRQHYQKVIIKYASQRQMLQPALASHLSFGETKKRIEIMVKTKNKPLNLIRQTAALTVIMVLFVLLGKTEVIAQQVVPPPPPPPTKATVDQSNKEGTIVIKSQGLDEGQLPAPPRLVRFHVKSLVSYKDETGKAVQGTFEDLPEQIQKDFLNGKLIDGKIWMPPPPERPLTNAMLEKYKDASTYGVWVDNTRIDNADLKNYKPGDFHHFDRSRLYKGASHYGQYTYQVTLVTHKAVANEKSGRWIDAKIGEMPNRRVRKIEGGN